MKKWLAQIPFVVLALCVLFTSGCGNRELIDFTYTYDEAILMLPDGTVVQGPVESWCDYENSDQIEVTIDGETYLVHSMNCVLIARD